MARLKRTRSPAVLVSCEHASNRVPSRYENLGLDARALRSHIAWDIGATPKVDGHVRNADVGILYDRQRRGEADLARRWAREISRAGVRVRLNYPYRGTADGLCKTLRRQFADSAYAGLELEMNQRRLADPDALAHIRRVTRDAFLAIVRPSKQAAG